mmetsp:Transcript_37553/g.63978  ORF Transcript_37553/g.63978 Transcript_37553/m.63978 type:complete len:114 (-) Transcript_37553:4-345(-)
MADVLVRVCAARALSLFLFVLLVMCSCCVRSNALDEGRHWYFGRLGKFEMAKDYHRRLNQQLMVSQKTIAETCLSLQRGARSFAKLNYDNPVCSAVYKWHYDACKQGALEREQ